MKNKAELLVPAGSIDKLKTAFMYGADAVYMGLPDFSMRVQSQISLEDLVYGIEYAHSLGKKVYLTLNLFTHNRDIARLPALIDTVKKANPDGVLISDPAVFMYVKEHAPEIPLHISTQANICSYMSVDFWKQQGASLCVLARELSFEELKEIRAKCPDIRLETFVHGSMCMSYSGRCLLSNFMSGRSANQGNCSHSCRWNYKLHMKLKDKEDLEITEANKDLFEFLLEEGVREGEFMPVEELENGAYILNSKDLCLMPKLDKYLDLGIDTLKLEGRNKNIYYLATVTRAYRQAIDDYYADSENWNAEKYMPDLWTVSNRGYTLGFYNGQITDYGHNYDNNRSLSQWEFAGYVTEIDNEYITVAVKNRIFAEQKLEFITPQSNIAKTFGKFINAKNNEWITEVHSGGTKPMIKIPVSDFSAEEIAEIAPFTIIRREKSIREDEANRIKNDRKRYGEEI